MMSSKIKVLFLAANPIGSGSSLRLDEEAREIDRSIQFGRNRDSLELVSCLAVRASDLQDVLLRHQPQIVHFSGHGQADKGIFLEDNSGKPKPVDREALAGLFDIFKNTIKAVILNACESEHTTSAFCHIVDYTIGMSKPIGDKVAIIFASAFYRALAYGESVPTAFRLGVNRIKEEGSAEWDIPTLTVRKGVKKGKPLLTKSEITRAEESGDRVWPGGIIINDSKVGQVNEVRGNGNTFIGFIGKSMAKSR